MKKFALIGAAGFVAPRHMKAIKDTGNELVAALDPNDSVGVLDSYFPECKFFTEFERFERHLDKLFRRGEGIDYLSICSPNYLHDAHCRMGMRVGANVICEKPVVINPWNLDQLAEIEKETSKKIYTVLQLRLYPELIELKKSLSKDISYLVELYYVTPRGPWYHYSWKGNEEKSGGITVNIGVHLFDLMIWLFGKPKGHAIKKLTKERAYGMMNFENAYVDWYLSLNRDDDPTGQGKPYRRIKINLEELRFDTVFKDLHTEVYKDILNGGGYGIEDVRSTIEFLNELRGYNEIPIT